MIQKISKSLFATVKAPQLPIIDTMNFLQKKGDYQEQCKQVADSLYKYGALVMNVSLSKDHQRPKSVPRRQRLLSRHDGKILRR